jgi:arylsulfatase
MKLAKIMALLLAIGFATGAHAKKQPNIVLFFVDNLGYGELGSYGGGITRGGATPRLDALAKQGMRLTNFNVEAQCTPSRAAILTGRYAIRTGAATVPITTGTYGLTQWEYTMAEMLSDAGYSTAMYGKWHLGHTSGRFPTDQGFDEWYGTPNSTDESFWPEQPEFNAVVKEGLSPFMTPSYIYEGRKGKGLKKVKVYGPQTRREIDGEITQRALDYIDRQADSKKPFFLYLPYTQTHYPVNPSKEFEGASGNGHWGDILMQLDTYAGRLLDKLEQTGQADDTIFIFTSDNGPEYTAGYQGWSGPWRGSYFTALEGSLRVPFIIRWPGKVPEDVVSNEIVHEIDLYATFAKWAGAKVPTDRVIDSIDQGKFFTESSGKSDRDAIMLYVGSELFGVKWRHWKMTFKELDKGGDAIRTYGVPHFVNLFNDPKEEYPITKDTPESFWVRWPMSEHLKAHTQSLLKEPPIKAGTPDPWQPK